MKSILPDVTIPDVSFAHFMLDRLKRHGEKTAAVDTSSGEKMTYREMVSTSDKLTAALHARGLRKGDKLMLCTPNCVQFPIIVVAVTRLGAVVTTANPNYIKDELLLQMKNSQTTYVITATSCADKIKAAAVEYGGVKEIISLGEAPGCTSFNYVVATGVPSRIPRVDIDLRQDVAIMPYSSGTTGSPKGVMLTHYNLVANLCQTMTPHTMTSLAMRGESVVLAVMPFYHIYGLIVIEMVTLALGGTLVVQPKFDLVEFLDAVQKHKVSTLFVVPPLVLLLAKSPVVSRYDLTSVQEVFSGAAPLGADLAKEVTDRLNVPFVRQGYGLTETSPVTHMPPVTDAKEGSVGYVVANTECKVIDIGTGQDLGADQDGEICIRGPQVMKGYFGLAGATAATIDSDGWLHTGDIGHYGKDNHFYIVDRLKELIKYKGLQVAPADLESLLLTHPAVADAAVIGVPDAEAGELPRAYVVLKEGISATEQEITDFVAARVSPHKKLRGGVVFRSEVPKSPSGKILRRFLRAEAANTQQKSKL